MSEPVPKVLAVDDLPTNLALLEATLVPRGYDVVSAGGGHEALAMVPVELPDLVLLDIDMPGMDGYEVCRRLRAEPATQFLPIVMVTAAAGTERVKAIEAGADDFITKPFDKAELLARVASLLRVKRYHDTIERQRKELAELNRDLQARVAAQVEELERLRRLRRFLSPQVADLVLSGGDESILEIHRAHIAVLFCDIRGFTSFSNAVQPDVVTEVLDEYHEMLGRLVRRFEATVGFFAGDGLMVFFNDPVAQPDPGPRATRMALEIRAEASTLSHGWRTRGHDLGVGIGIDVGEATLGEVGFEGRFDYTAIGTVVNMAARLCDRAAEGQILMTETAAVSVEDEVRLGVVGELPLKGYAEPVPVWNVVDLLDRQTRLGR